ncbi:MAG: molecular chaperone TorD family protein [Planctomycetota bacterium]|jgi:TorA maturation chaperone TorD
MTDPALPPVARLLGWLLLRELDAATLASLETLRPELEAIGLSPPETDDLEELAAQYYAAFLDPAAGVPLVQSLHEGDGYEGEAARSVRAIAEAAGLELDTEQPRGAPQDHLGLELLLWSELAERDGAAAGEFARRHLSWAVAVLARRDGAGFYDRLGSITAAFIRDSLPS